MDIESYLGNLNNIRYITKYSDNNKKEFALKYFSIKNEDGQNKYFVLIIYNIFNYEYNSKNEIRNLQIQLKKSHQEIDQFVYITSHDLQEPLRMIASFVQLLQKKYHNKLSDEANEYIQFAVEGSNRLKDLLNDLLIYSRLNTTEENITRINMNVLFSKLLSKFEYQILKSNTEIIIDDLPDMNGKFNQISLLFENLLSNALKFNNKEKKKIEISGKLNGSFIQFFIKDNGIGIPEKFNTKIFEIFQRLHNYKEYYGTGIGLALCKKIVSNHNGMIWIESRSGIGSTFFVKFPIVT